MNSANQQLTCAGCMGAIDGRLYLHCCVCEANYDLNCANVPEKRFYNTMTTEHKQSWKCVSCISDKYVARNDDTPATPSSASASAPFRDGPANVNTRRGGSTNQTQNDLYELKIPKVDGAQATIQDLTNALNLFRGEFKREMLASRLQLSKLDESFSKLATRVVVCENRIDALTSRIENIEHRINKIDATEKPDGASMLETVEELKAELNSRDQEFLLNDVELSCIPEQNNENLQHITMALAKKIGVDVSENDIVHASRVGRQESVDVGPARRPRPIVVRLARRALRDQLLQAARVRRGATTEGTDLPGPPRRFYLNERLTRVNRLLFRRARDLGDQKGWRFVWTRDGRIYARQHAGRDAPRHRIRVESDLQRVFKSENV
ncbi:hypothetical protein O0L34_g9796 [Tuta absoluta]|nr:hypothetical protein O0L34_g19440 [Tuta absoluta]KAJ2948004.1 hypothetical protein O0L34_g9796 [Tuta absoluta]